MKIKMNYELLELYSTGRSKRYKDIARNPVLYGGFVRAVDAMLSAQSIDELRNISVLHYERLRYNLSGYSSVRLANSYVHRLLFTESEDGLKVELIQIDNTHYGKK